MNYNDWIAKNMTKRSVTVRDCQVAVWQSPLLTDRPTMLLVHGITGDHFGLVPLAYELSKDYNCLVIELAGHGASEELKFEDADDLQAWFVEAHDEINRQIATIDSVCAHSFGCMAVVGKSNAARTTKTVLLNPVPHPSGIYRQYAHMIVGFSSFWALFYNLRVFVFLRGLTLAKVNTREARKRVGWVSKYSRPSYRQVIYQAKLVDIILDTTAYADVKDKMSLIVCGLEDTLADQRDSLELEAVFGNSQVMYLRGGHLLPIESPERVAQLLRKVL
jgi:pimeloyl-ACP methyl ester carboxylesterase